jgi:hypothetical protein
LATAEESGTDSIVYFAQTNARYVQLARRHRNGHGIFGGYLQTRPNRFYEVCSRVRSETIWMWTTRSISDFFRITKAYGTLHREWCRTGVQLFLLDQAVHNAATRSEKCASTELNLESEFKDVYFAEMEFTNADE